MIKFMAGQKVEATLTREYPYIANASTAGRLQVVLFTSKDTGVCLFDGFSPKDTGKVMDGWIEEAFIPLKSGESVVLVQV